MRTTPKPVTPLAATLFAFVLVSCGGGSAGSGDVAAPAVGGAPAPATSPAPGPASGPAPAPGPAGSPAPGPAAPAPGPAPGPAPTPAPPPSINAALGKPARLLGGLGAGNSIADMNAQQIRPDIIDTYLVGVGSGSWPTWNSPEGAYITYVSANVKAAGALPMFTLYQMASNGDGSINGITNPTFMTSY